MPQDLTYLTIAELAPMIRQRRVSASEAVEHALTRVSALNPTLNAFITVTDRLARQQAKEADEEIRAGKYRGPLHGVPISIKDLFATKGIKTTAGSKVLASWVPDFDATAVAKLRAAGAVIIGKNHMHEFAYGVTSDNPFYGPARNPWNPALVPGGSSGGSGIAVATSMGIASLGSDSGGSIRTPASVCGIVGLKPTYGRVSRHGGIPLAWSLDHVGPLSKSVMDAAIMLNALAGPDPLDESCSTRPVPDYTKSLGQNISGMRIGIPREYFFDNVDPEILKAVRAAISQLQSLGARSVPVSLPNLDTCSAQEAHITLAEATSYHEPYLKKQPDDYGPGVRTDLEAGRYLLASDYVKSQRARRLIQQNFLKAFQEADVIISPMLPAFPPKIGDMFVQSGALREHVVDAFLRFNIPCDLTGYPSISVPCGFGSNGLPIGLQIAGKPFDESTVLKVAHAYEQSTEWHRRRPEVKV